MGGAGAPSHINVQINHLFSQNRDAAYQLFEQFLLLLVLSGFSLLRSPRERKKPTGYKLQLEHLHEDNVLMNTDDIRFCEKTGSKKVFWALTSS